MNFLQRIFAPRPDKYDETEAALRELEKLNCQNLQVAQSAGRVIHNKSSRLMDTMSSAMQLMERKDEDNK